jgi:ABC-type transport system involved in multi-copper enzyme maturation permease subunit
MLPGPVFNAELLTLSRRKRIYALRFLYGALLLFFVTINFPWYVYGGRFGETRELSIAEMAMIGQSTTGAFLNTQYVVIVLLTPALVAGVIADEKQRKTLHYLLASQLTSSEIVLGKLAARLLLLAVFLGVGLPILALLSFFGGVDPNEVFLSFASCAGTAFFLAAASVALSVHVKRPRDAVTVVYLFGTCWLFGPIIVRGLFENAQGGWAMLYPFLQPFVEWIGWSSPVYVAEFTRLGGAYSPAYVAVWSIGLRLLYGAGFAAVAVARLRPVYRREGTASRRVLGTRLWGARRRWGRPGCGDDPMLWKECHASRAGFWTRLVATIIGLSVAAMIGFSLVDPVAEAVKSIRSDGYFVAAYGSNQDRLNDVLRGIITGVYVCWALVVATAAAGRITGEREEDTWISLLATSLTPVEILRGKMLGALWSSRWVGLFWFSAVLTGLALAAVHPLGLAASVLTTAVYLAFACAVGTFYSLHLPTTTRALSATVGTLFVCNIGYLLVVIPFVSGRGFLGFAAVTPFMELISLMDYQDFTWLTGTGDGSMFMPMSDGWKLVGTWVVSLGGYATAAALLTLFCLANFDWMNDRPLPPGRPAPAADDPGPEKSGEGDPGRPAAERTSPTEAGRN